MAHNGKDLDEFESTRAERYFNEPSWRWSSKKREIGDYYPPVGDELVHDLSNYGGVSGRDDESRLADYIAPDALEIHQARARRKKQAKDLLRKGAVAGIAAIKTGKASGKSALKKGGAALTSGGRALVKGAELAVDGINRYGKWADEIDAKAFQRGELRRQTAFNRQQVELDQRRAAMEFQREQRQLDLEERRMQLELQREEMQFRREFGADAAPPRPGPSYGFAPRPRQAPISPFSGSTHGFGVPEPGFENPRDIIMRGSGINLFGTPEPERRPAKKKKQSGASKKKR